MAYKKSKNVKKKKWQLSVMLSGDFVWFNKLAPQTYGLLNEMQHTQNKRKEETNPHM